MYGQPTERRALFRGFPYKSKNKYGLFKITVKPRADAIEDDLHLCLDGKIGGIVDLSTGFDEKGHRNNGWLFYLSPCNYNQETPLYFKPEYHRVKLNFLDRFWKKDYSQVIIVCEQVVIILDRILRTWKSENFDYLYNVLPTIRKNAINGEKEFLEKREAEYNKLKESEKDE